MGKKNYIEEDEDGIIIYDESDDQCDDEIVMEGIINDEDGFRLKENEEIFTDEYMMRYDEYMTAKIARMKRKDRMISVGVILFVVAVIFCAIIFAIPASAQIFNPNRPMIREFVVCVDSINDQMGPRLRGQSPLTEDYGWVFIPNTYYVHNGKSLGIIIVRDCTETYHAKDARCAHCFYDNGESDGFFEMGVGFSGRCRKCGAEADNIKIHGSGQMMRYDHGARGPVCLDGYVVEEVKKDKKTYLLITNAHNGTRSEWKDLPENQILLDNGEMYESPRWQQLNPRQCEYPHY